MAMGRAVAEPYGALRVTAAVDIGQALLAPLAAAFTERYPRVRFEVDLTARLVDVASEGYDAAIRVWSHRPPSSALVARRLARLDLGLYAGRPYLARRDPPKRPEDLVRHEHVLFRGTAGHALLVLEGPAGTSRVRVEGRVDGNDFFFVREAIAVGAGLGPLPWFVAAAEVRAGASCGSCPPTASPGRPPTCASPARPASRKLDAFRASSSSTRLASLAPDALPPARRRGIGIVQFERGGRVTKSAGPTTQRSSLAVDDGGEASFDAGELAAESRRVAQEALRGAARAQRTLLPRGTMLLCAVLWRSRWCLRCSGSSTSPRP